MFLTPGTKTHDAFRIFNGSQYFTTSGTFTVPRGVFNIQVEIWGAGGGGGYSSSAGTVPASGGGSGSYVFSVLSVRPRQSFSVTIGAAGTGGSSTSTTGSSGGTTTFSSLSAGGGTGGATTGSAAGQGGAVLGSGMLNINGMIGKQCAVNDQSNGGDAPRGGSGGITGIGAGAAQGGKQPGGGGGGGAAPAASGQAGGPGAAGGVLIVW